MNDHASGNNLGDLVVRAALIEARRHVAAGATTVEAADRVCRGAWAPYRATVERHLRAGDAASEDGLPAASVSSLRLLAVA